MAKRGRTRRLTDLELEVMHAVWEAQPTALTVRETVARMEEAGGKKLAYTTVQTVLNILCKKGVLRSRPGPARAHLYSAALSREEATSRMTRDFIERLFGGEAQPLMARLLEHESITREELEALKRAIESQLEDDLPEPEGGPR